MRTPVRLLLFLILAVALPVAGQNGPLNLSNFAIPGARKAPAMMDRAPQYASIRVDVRMALTPVNVIDPNGRNVTGLQRENFRLLDGKEAREISSFGTEDQPISVGVIVDCSGSMENKFAAVREAPAQLFRQLSDSDESFLITVSESSRIRHPFTSQFEELTNDLLFAAPNGQTALLDGVYMGLAQIRMAKNPRRALVIVSDGGDNDSRYTLRELKRVAMEADVQIYAIGLHENPLTIEEEDGPQLLKELADATGGINFDVKNPAHLGGIMGQIGAILHNQYVLGFYPPQDALAGKYRKITVKLLAPSGIPPLHVFARAGYYTPDNLGGVRHE